MFYYLQKFARKILSINQQVKVHPSPFELYNVVEQVDALS